MANPQYDQRQYDQRRQQRPPQQSVPLVLTDEDVDSILRLTANGQLKFNADQIRLICEKQQPGLKASLQLADFKTFIYMCATKGLNPLLNEAHIEYRKDNSLNDGEGGFKAANVTHIDGYRKIADATNLLNGKEIIFGEENNGYLIYAEAIIHRKDYEFPVKARVYRTEMLGDGFMHKKMPHVILGKDAEAAGLRSAFAAALSGFYIQEEVEAPTFNRGEEASPTSPAENGTNGNAGNTVGGYAIGVKPEPQPETAAAPAPAPAAAPATNGKANGTNGKNGKANGTATAPAPTPAAAPEPAPSPATPPPVTQDDIVQLSNKLWERTGLKASAQCEFYAGWFGVSPEVKDRKQLMSLLPRDLGELKKALDAALHRFNLHAEYIAAYKADPRKFGAELRNPAQKEDPALEPAPAAQQQEPAKATAAELREKYGWSDQVANIALAACQRRNCTAEELGKTLESMGVTLEGSKKWPLGRAGNLLMILQHTDKAYIAVDLFNKHDMPLAATVREIERRVGKNLGEAGVDAAAVDKALEEIAAAGPTPGLF